MLAVLLFYLVLIPHIHILVKSNDVGFRSLKEIIFTHFFFFFF